MNLKSTSKFLSLILRHRPEVIGIQLDKNGWVEIEVLLNALEACNKKITRQELDYIVANNDKKRYIISEDGKSIRANQGHSIEVDLDLKPMLPPDILYHGTAENSLASILKEGIQKRSRQHVHLSADIETARKVGSRHGKVVILKVDTVRMREASIDFFISANEVWLTDFVAPEYVSVFL